MAAIKEKLEKEDPQVEIVEGTDDVCKNCPHNMGGACENEDSVRQHDKRVYDKVIETVGNSAKWSSITKAIRENIIDSGKMRETCGKCQWSDICFKNQNNKYIFQTTKGCVALCYAPFVLYAIRLDICDS